MDGGALLIGLALLVGHRTGNKSQHEPSPSAKALVPRFGDTRDAPLVTPPLVRSALDLRTDVLVCVSRQGNEGAGPAVR